MPRGDGKGPPWGSGPGTGSSREARGAGRMGGTSPGAGLGGDCICPVCGAKKPHQAGTPCYNLSCPKCGAKMVRG
jgi:hypothetical protein